MAAGPVEFVDSLVKGMILVAYDFIRLSLAGIVLPFIRKKPKFWRSVILVNRRLSSLTYLVLWALIAVCVAFGNTERVVWEASGYGQKSSDFPIVPTVIVTALIVSIVVDLSLRVIFFFSTSN